MWGHLPSAACAIDCWLKGLRNFDNNGGRLSCQDFGHDFGHDFGPNVGHDVRPNVGPIVGHDVRSDVGPNVGPGVSHVGKGVSASFSVFLTTVMGKGM